jgi:hypothetical protein
VTIVNPAGGARFGVRQLAAAFRTASLLAVRTQAVAKRARREQARSTKAAASGRTPKRLRRRQAASRVITQTPLGEKVSRDGVFTSPSSDGDG